MRISAAVLRDPDGPFGLEPVDLADPGPGEVLVEVSGVGFVLPSTAATASTDSRTG